MRSHRVGIALVLLAVASLTGCADLSLRAERMRAEKLLWEARREEQRVRLGGVSPDSAGVARLRALYRKVRDEVPVPPPDTTVSVTTQRLRAALVDVVGQAELSGARLAMEARRPGEALERAKWLMSFAGQDTFLRREAHFRVIDALQGLHRYDEAVQEMWLCLDQYPPVPPRRPDEQDPILKMPSLIVMLHQQLGDTASVPVDLRRGVDYYQRLLSRNPTPLLQAQILSHLTQAQAQLGDRAGALGSLEILERVVSATPELASGRAEVLCSKGDLESMPGGNRARALAAYNEVVQKYPDTPLAPRALLGVAVVEEAQGRKKEALVQYRALLDRYSSDQEHGPIALFRSAMLQEQLGDWPAAKQLLESAPLRYPRARVAMEAPIAVVQHYVRAHDGASERAALVKAVDTYRRLIASDSTNPMNVAFRWSIARCYAGLERWTDALATIDEMSAKDRQSPLTANAVLEAARISERLGKTEQRTAYLKRFLVDYPRAPQANVVRAMLEPGGRVRAAGGGSKPGGHKR